MLQDNNSDGARTYDMDVHTLLIRYKKKNQAWHGTALHCTALRGAGQRCAAA